MNIEEVVKELRKVMHFKHSTEKGDLLLVVMENPRTAFYAIVTEIERDISKKDEWWHLTLHILTVPPQKTVWTLRVEQFTGREVFTMGGEKRFIQAVSLVDEEDMPGGTKGEKGDRGGKTGLRLVK